MSGSTNGRIYDPHLARFVQADPFVQAPSDLQSLNRYSYLTNNPLNATDPSGFIKLKEVVGFVLAVAVSIACYGTCSPAVWAAWGAGAGAVGGYAATGTLRGAFFGAISGAAFGYLGGTFAGAGGVIQSAGGIANVSLATIGKFALAYGAVGGITSMLQGGKFGHGFVSAGVGFAIGAGLGQTGIGAKIGSIGRVLTAAVVGGTLSDATGGKFANGAAFAAFSAVVGELAYREKNGNKIPEDLASNIEKVKAAMGDEWDDSWTYEYQDKDVSVVTDPNSPAYKARIGGRASSPGVSSLVAEYTVVDGHGHVIFYRGYNNPNAISQSGSHWSLNDVQQMDGELIVTNRPHKYSPDQTTQHVILHEFGGHGLGNDGFTSGGGNYGDFMRELLADQWAGMKMRELGFSQ